MYAFAARALHVELESDISQNAAQRERVCPCVTLGVRPQVSFLRCAMQYIACVQM